MIMSSKLYEILKWIVQSDCLPGCFHGDLFLELLQGPRLRV